MKNKYNYCSTAKIGFIQHLLSLPFYSYLIALFLLKFSIIPAFWKCQYTIEIFDKFFFSFIGVTSSYNSIHWSIQTRHKIQTKFNKLNASLPRKYFPNQDLQKRNLHKVSWLKISSPTIEIKKKKKIYFSELKIRKRIFQKQRNAYNLLNSTQIEASI